MLKKYIDIENLRESEILLNGLVTRGTNDQLFEVGDIISISEKFDGSNFSATWENNEVQAFSRRRQLNSTNTLNGAYEYVKTMNDKPFKENPNLIFFGEWATKNKITYNQESMQKWYIFDIWNKTDQIWLNPTIVKEICKKYGLLYIHEFYIGPFISWDHCKSFMNLPQYGNRQEGVVVRNISKYNNTNYRFPFILKIVNDHFRETKSIKIKDPKKDAEKEEATKILASIVTENRIEKMLRKLQEDQLIPENLIPQDMVKVAKVLPKAIFEDCLKEEPEIMEAYSEYAGKLVGSMTMAIARKLLNT
jgi:hypothetical protein